MHSFGTGFFHSTMFVKFLCIVRGHNSLSMPQLCGYSITSFYFTVGGPFRGFQIWLRIILSMFFGEHVCAFLSGVDLGTGPLVGVGCALVHLSCECSLPTGVYRVPLPPALCERVLASRLHNTEHFLFSFVLATLVSVS